jgi:hypothetical protein
MAAMSPGQEEMEVAITTMWPAQTEFEETISKRVEGLREELDTEFQWTRFVIQVTKKRVDITWQDFRMQLAEVKDNWKIWIIMRYQLIQRSCEIPHITDHN